MVRPEATRIAFTTPFPSQVVVPLDVTDTVNYGKPEYDRIAGGPMTPIEREFADHQGPRFATDPNYRTNLWDAVAAVFPRPELITGSSVGTVMVDPSDGPDHGRTVGFRPDHGPTTARRGSRTSGSSSGSTSPGSSTSTPSC